MVQTKTLIERTVGLICEPGCFCGSVVKGKCMLLCEHFSCWVICSSETPGHTSDCSGDTLSFQTVVLKSFFALQGLLGVLKFWFLTNLSKTAQLLPNMTL